MAINGYGSIYDLGLAFNGGIRRIGSSKILFALVLFLIALCLLISGCL